MRARSAGRPRGAAGSGGPGSGCEQVAVVQGKRGPEPGPGSVGARGSSPLVSTPSIEALPAQGRERLFAVRSMNHSRSLRPLPTGTHRCGGEAPAPRPDPVVTRLAG